MRSHELYEYSSNKPIIVVDVQPEYTGVNSGDELYWIDDLMAMLNTHRGNILMLANAEDQGLSGDTVNGIQMYWEDSGFDGDAWNKVKIFDKGYGYLRSWMDNGVPENVIIRVIREMYQQRVSDSRMLFDGDESEDYVEKMAELGVEEEFLADAISVEWICLKMLKQYSGGYICGGGEEECLKEVMLLMNAFNMKYKLIREFVY